MAATHSFSLFPRLPGELRNQIWSYAIEISPPQRVVRRYRRGGWKPRQPVPEQATDNVSNSTTDNPALEWKPDVLGRIKFDMPLARVSREARGVVLAWMADNGMAVHVAPPSTDNKATNPPYTRPFDPSSDIIYIKDTDITYFDHLDRRVLEPDLVEKTGVTRSPIQHVAFSHTLFWKKISKHRVGGGFAGLLSDNHLSPRAVYVIILDFNFDREIELQGDPWYCDLEPTKTVAVFRWDKAKRTFVHQKDLPTILDDDIAAETVEILTDRAVQYLLHTRDGIGLCDGFEVWIIHLVGCTKEDTCRCVVCIDKLPTSKRR